MFKRIVYLAAFILAFNANFFAQETAEKDSSAIHPTIYIKDGDVLTENFPACSEDGKYLVLIYDEYSCCMSTDLEMQLIEIKNVQIKKTILLSPNENENEFSPEKQLKVLANTKHLLKMYPFHSMIALDSFDISTDTIKQNFCIHFNTQTGSFKSREFTLPALKLPFYCCGYENDNEPPCDYNPEVREVWMDTKYKFLLVEYGIIHMMDGCDNGPYFMVLNIQNR